MISESVMAAPVTWFSTDHVVRAWLNQWTAITKAAPRSHLALVAWRVSERVAAPSARRLLLACLIVLTAVGGFAAASHRDTSVLALTVASMIAAGLELPLWGVFVVFLAGVLAIEIGAVNSRNTDLGTVLGYPALLAALAMFGRYRRAYRRKPSRPRHW